MRKRIRSSQEAIELQKKYMIETYRPHNFAYSKGRGLWVYGPERGDLWTSLLYFLKCLFRKELWKWQRQKKMEMLSCYSALGEGHCSPEILDAFTNQARRYWHGSRAFYNDVAPLLAKELVEFCGMSKVIFMNTGTEVDERAIKIARKWGYTVKGIPKYKAEIIGCYGGFHGRTLASQSISADPLYEPFYPLLPGFIQIPYGDLEALEKAINENTCAFIVEPIQGEAGVIVPPAGFLRKAKEICEKNNVLFILDEIQTGLGRCGKRFAYEYEDAKPNVLLLGKFLGGGPGQISATVCDEKTADVLKPPEDGSTFSCNPMECAAARVVLRDIVEKKLPERAYELGSYFMEELKELKNPYVKEVRGKGLLIAVELKHELGGARPFVDKLIEEGLLCHETHVHNIRFAPPLIIKKKEIDWALKKIKKVLRVQPNKSEL